MLPAGCTEVEFCREPGSSGQEETAASLPPFLHFAVLCSAASAFARTPTSAASITSVHYETFDRPTVTLMARPRLNLDSRLHLRQVPRGLALLDKQLRPNEINTSPAVAVSNRRSRKVDRHRRNTTLRLHMRFCALRYRYNRNQQHYALCLCFLYFWLAGLIVVRTLHLTPQQARIAFHQGRFGGA